MIKLALLALGQIHGLALGAAMQEGPRQRHDGVALGRVDRSRRAECQREFPSGLEGIDGHQAPVLARSTPIMRSG